MTALSLEEKVRVRHHMGYLNVQEAQTFTLGTPAAVETQFLIEGAMNKVLPEAMPLLRRYLEMCDETENTMFCDQETLVANRLGEIDLNNQGEHRNQRELRRSYKYWQTSLANLLGVPPNPFDQRTQYGLGGVNVRVQH